MKLEFESVGGLSVIKLSKIYRIQIDADPHPIVKNK